ncbi:MAG: c-type cytochrome [Akkermansiaceae bacterium]
MKKQIVSALLCSITSLIASPTSAERGKEVYMQICFTCHGPQLDGGIGPSLKDPFWKHGSSPQAILDAIDNGIEGTEMIGYKNVYPEADRLALRDFILSEQEGLRGMVRSIYPGAPFKSKPLSLEIVNSVESVSQTALPENWISVERNTEGVLRASATAYIREPGDYRFVTNRAGRTVIYFDGKVVYTADEKSPKTSDQSEVLKLQPGTYEVEILHEEKRAHSYRFNGSLSGPKGKRFPLAGRSLQGNVPKFIVAGPKAKVARKWIDGLPPRTLLCVLPNKVIVAYNAQDGSVLKAWHSAEINQTPSLPDRSQQPSAMKGEEIAEPAKSHTPAEDYQFLGYEITGPEVLIHHLTAGQTQTLVIAPEGEQSFTISTKSF